MSCVIICPQCASKKIVVYDDKVHAVKVVRCGTCGLSFAVKEDELYRYFISSPVYEDDVKEFINSDWHMAYNAKPKIEDGKQ